MLHIDFANAVPEPVFWVETMKKFFYGLLLLAWAFVLSPVQAEDADSGAFEIRVLTFNIRTSRGEVGKPEEWKNRRRGVVELIRRGDYDFVGVQEAIFSPQRARLNQVDYLKAALPGYGMIYRPRGESETQGEGTPLLYNRSRWVLDESEHGIFWLSQTPDVPGSRCDGSRLPRTVCWGRFIRLENGKPTDRAVYVFNTHFDLAFQAKVEGTIILAEFIAKRKHDDPVFITGDMNCAKDSLPMRYFAGERIETKIEDKEYDAVSPVKLQDVYGVLYPDTDETTYHGWGRRSSGVRIDFVWTSPGLEPVSSRVIKDKAHGLFLSDHYPVEAVVRLH